MSRGNRDIGAPLAACDIMFRSRFTAANAEGNGPNPSDSTLKILEFANGDQARRFRTQLYEAGLSEDAVDLEETSRLAMLFATDQKAAAETLEIAARLCNASATSQLN